jgi:hypothetical protein
MGENPTPRCWRDYIRRYRPSRNRKPCMIGL